jgi:hypothetical protein
MAKKQYIPNTETLKKKIFSLFSFGVEVISRNFGKVFVSALIVIALISISIWEKNFQSLGEDEEKIQALLDAKQNVVFDESLHWTLSRIWEKRSLNQNAEISVESIPFAISQKD